MSTDASSPSIASARVSSPPPADVGDRGPIPRLVALTTLALTVGALGWLVRAAAEIFTDSWIAPIELSPDSDAVLSLNLELTRQRAEIGRVAAEVDRFEAEIAAIDAGLARLHALRDVGRTMYEYGAEIRGAEADSLVDQIRHMREERVIVDRLIARQREELERARENLAAGLIERRDAELEEQSLDTLLLRDVELERSLSEAEALRREAREAEGEFRAELDTTDSTARMPEIVAREEADIRLEVEVLRLEAERRGLVSLLDVGRRSLDELRVVMAQIEARPAFRATREEMNVAFVPYEQLEGVEAGARLIECDFGIFNCHDVGVVHEVLTGEVVTQDPWGDLARGRYAILELSDETAVEERILRVR